jgi:hypothetical protein
MNGALGFNCNSGSYDRQHAAAAGKISLTAMLTSDEPEALLCL